MEELVRQFFNVEIMLKALPFMLQGLGMTAMLCIALVPLGLAGGLGVALVSTGRSRLLRIVMALAVDLFRAVPPLVLLIFIYSALPFAGVRLSPFMAVLLAFFLNTASFYGEIFRAGIESVGAGQWEAARATGLNRRQTLLHVIIPQATRNVLPDLASNTLEVVKLTSLASVVSFAELLYTAEMARSVTYNASPIVLAAFIYLLFMWPLVRLVSRMEHRVAQ
ncbi:MAG: amino acid ABC transporter permease [Beijerinckiaceae bacterium]|nr:amino acid ABC transporter permease [Beijerinckiaceae bacterium]MCZ8299720.1 amino acid ABC transporter permease [Beijerinckiaceae bacterium]